MIAQAKGEGDFGVFDRTYFKKVLFKDIASRMDTTHVTSTCDGFPIGVTATRIDPSYFQVTEQLTALTQRFAATFQLQRDVNGKRLVFRQSDPMLRDRGMGEMLALDVGKTWVIGTDTLFSLIEASSSFPIAFSPRQLSYYAADSLGPDGFCPMIRGDCAPSHKAYFTDGGVFDNNPLLLAFDIYERRAPRLDIVTAEGRLVTALPQVPPRALYVGTDDYRGPLQRKVTRTIDRGPVGGVDAIGPTHPRRHPGGATIRDADPRAFRSPTIGRVPREYIPRHEAVTSQSFRRALSALFGRVPRTCPFRELDFYAGALRRAGVCSARLICTPRAGFDPSREFGSPEGCAADYTRRLVQWPRHPARPDRPRVLTDMWAEEFGAARPQTPCRRVFAYGSGADSQPGAL
jgi:hypothetical protein